MKINLLAFFKLIENESYVVIKPSYKLPDYDKGSDIDIFCYDADEIAEKVTAFLADYVNHESTISIVDSPYKIHIDLLVNNEINFRFDLYKQLPVYKNINLKAAYFSSVIESSSIQVLTVAGDSSKIKVPSITDDLILRYVEYHEYYAERPDKIKHVEYIQNKLVSNKNKNEKVKMLDKLHYYTAFPNVVYRDKTLKEVWKEKRSYYQSNIVKIKHLYTTAGLGALVNKVIQKVRK